MTSQQKKAFEYIISAADGYGRTMPAQIVKQPQVFEDYSRFYKDIREDIFQTWHGWKIISDIVKLSHKDTDSWGMSWDYPDLKRAVYTIYKEIWGVNMTKDGKECFPSEYNMDIQMFDAYLLSPNCFNTICNAINNGLSSDAPTAGLKCFKDIPKHNTLIKSAKIAFIQKIALPEWNTENNFRNIKKDKWYLRTDQITQL